ncbi:hypothetical protein D3C72_1709730 [compost metagenome]
MQGCGAFHQGLHQHERGLGLDLAVGRFADHAGVADQVQHVARGEHLGAGDGHGAVVHHGAALGVDQPDGQAQLGVLARGHAVQPVFGEEAGPGFDLAGVQRRAVVGVEFLDFMAQRDGARRIDIAGGKFESGSHVSRFLPQNPITPR